MELDIETHLNEVQTKSEAEIEYETAQTWASRSAAAYHLVTQVPDLGNKIAWLMRAEDLRHEAVEHSSLADDEGNVLKQLKEVLQPHRELAISSILEVVNAPRLSQELNDTQS